MITFLRKIRQNLLSDGKTGIYLKYALGEIVLVVIGILIALQINNWNEEKKEQKAESKFIELLVQDLSSDADILTDLVLFSDASVASKNMILDYQDGKIPEPDSLSAHFMRAAFDGIQTFVPNKGAINEIQNAGGLSLIKNTQVSDQILTLYNEYDRFEKNVEHNYLHERNAMRQLVFSRANGNLFSRDLDIAQTKLTVLLSDGEIRDRLITNWAITYNRRLNALMRINSATIELCKEYINSINSSRN